MLTDRVRQCLSRQRNQNIHKTDSKFLIDVALVKYWVNAMTFFGQTHTFVVQLSDPLISRPPYGCWLSGNFVSLLRTSIRQNLLCINFSPSPAMRTPTPVCDAKVAHLNLSSWAPNGASNLTGPFKFLDLRIAAANHGFVGDEPNDNAAPLCPCQRVRHVLQRDLIQANAQQVLCLVDVLDESPGYFAPAICRRAIGDGPVTVLVGAMALLRVAHDEKRFVEHGRPLLLIGLSAFLLAPVVVVRAEQVRAPRIDADAGNEHKTDD